MIDAFPVLPNLHALFALAMMVIALFLFSRHQLRLEISSLAILILLALVFTVFPFMVEEQEFPATEFFHGFGHEALVAVCALMIIGQGMVHTGALKPLGRVLNRSWKVSFAHQRVCQSPYGPVKGPDAGGLCYHHWWHQHHHWHVD
jgi:di/tricarboxylate transporter